MTEIIGRGERTCLSILKSLYPEAEFMTVDAVQKKTLEFYDCKVIDIWYNDCPKLFADTYNDLSISELKEVYKDNGISV